MGKKQTLLDKLFADRLPKNFTVMELHTLMKQCGCDSFSGGRGSAIGFLHKSTGRVLHFDGPHPQKELYSYQVKMVRNFLKEIGEA